MHRRGNGNAPHDDHDEYAADQPDGGRRVSGSADDAGTRETEIAELSRRALTAEINLLAYVDELEAEVRRLRRQLDGDALAGAADGRG